MKFMGVGKRTQSGESELGQEAGSSLLLEYTAGVG